MRKKLGDLLFRMVCKLKTLFDPGNTRPTVPVVSPIVLVITEPVLVLGGLHLQEEVVK